MLPQDKKLYETLSDEELILRFQKEDNDAFSQLVTRYKDHLVNFLFRYTGGRDEAEDIAQDTFLRLYRLKHTYKEVGKFSSWFYTCLLYTSVWGQVFQHRRG